MYSFWELAQVSAAYVIAIVLAAIGISYLSQKDMTKRGIFMAALSFFLMGDLAIAQDSAPSNNQSQQQQLSKPNSLLLPLPPELSLPGKWEAFKRFWQKLDEIDTQKKTEDKDKKDSAPAFFDKGSLTKEAREALITELDKLLSQTLQSNITKDMLLFSTISPLPKGSEPTKLTQLLFFMLNQRIQGMSPDLMALTRMVPSLRMTYPRTIQKRIEVRIDLLMTKQKDGSITDVEYKAIIGSIEQDVYLLALLKTLPHINNFYGPVKEDIRDIAATARMELPKPRPVKLDMKDEPDAWIRGLEKAYSEQSQLLSEALHKEKDKAKRKDLESRFKYLNDVFKRASKQIEELQSLRKPLRILLEDLETRPAAPATQKEE